VRLAESPMAECAWRNRRLNLQRGRARRGCVTSRRATERVASEVGRAKMDRGMRA